MAKRTLPKHPVNAIEIYKAAEAFLKLSKEGIKVNVDDPFSFSLKEAYFANHAFACELYLKCIYGIEKGTTTGGQHLLWDTFDELSPEAKERIIELYEERRSHLTETELIFGLHCDFETALTEPGNAYQRFRYSYEPHKPLNWSYRLNYVLFAFKKYILEIQPDWPILNHVE
jgi:hypothetical protein